jgi:hypothetical protein
MMLHITQERLNATDLVVLVDREGRAQWSSHRSDTEIINMLRGIADLIEARQLTKEVQS